MSPSVSVMVMMNGTSRYGTCDEGCGMFGWQFCIAFRGFDCCERR